MQAIALFCNWLGATPLSQTLQSVSWIVPTVQSIHIVGIAMVVAPTILLNMRLLGVGGKSQPIPRLFASLMPVVWCALLALVISGALLIIAEPKRELLNIVFQTKMALLIGDVASTAGLQRWAASKGPSPAQDAPPPGARAAALLSLILFVAIIGCGRWIAYVQ